MENMDAWGGREGVFVIERLLEIVRGLYGWEIEGGACAIERCPERNRDRPCTCL